MPPHKLLRRACAVLCALGAAAPATAAATGPSQPEYLVQLRPDAGQGAGRDAIAAAGGRVTRELHIIHAFGARLSHPAARRLRARPQVASVVRNSRMEPSAATTEHHRYDTANGLQPVARDRSHLDGPRRDGQERDRRRDRHRHRRRSARLPHVAVRRELARHRLGRHQPRGHERRRRLRARHARRRTDRGQRLLPGEQRQPVRPLRRHCAERPPRLHQGVRRARQRDACST